MTALAAVFRRDLEPVDRGLFEALMAALTEPAADGEHVAELGWVTLGARSFWTTPEEVGERQPLHEPEGRCALLFDGRLDNRAELLRELGVPAAVGATLSDAAIVLRFLATGRWDALKRFLGPWVLVFVDRKAREVTLARDAIGDRTLCWHATRHQLVAASEPAAILRATDVSRKVDEVTLAAFFAGWPPRPEATFFEAVRQVPPGHRLVVTATAERLERFWTPELRLLRLRRDEEYAELFRSVLEEAVVARLRSPAPPAVLMSGGLDSTTVAAHAARHQRRTGGPAVRSVSWVFDELPEADEREFIQPMIDALGIEPHWVVGDDCWPLKGLETWSLDPNFPYENPYRPLHGRAYAKAAQIGAKTLVTGHYSDEMYCGVEGYWLRDLVARGQGRATLACLRDELRYRRHPEAWTPNLREVVPRLLLGRGWTRLRAPRAPDWLQPAARAALRRLPAETPATPHPEQVSSVLPPTATMGISVESRRTRQHGLDLRFPFRDRRVLELALSIPADQLVRPGWRKRLIWVAADGLLPDAVRLRRRMSHLGPLFARGPFGAERQALREILLPHDERIWPRWVAPELIERMTSPPATRVFRGLSWKVFWQCISTELWHRAAPEISMF